MIPWLLVLAAWAGPAEDALGAGRAAQRAGDVAAAKAAYARCLATDPDQVACHWELGWSRWTEQDWDGVLAAWRQVRQRDPAWPELDRWTAEAEANQADAARLATVLAARPAEVRPPLPAGTTLRLRAVGDVMMGTDGPGPVLPPQDGATLLDGVADLLRDADLTFANLEGPLCDGGTTRKCRPDSDVCYAFRTPTRYGAYLDAVGVDLASTANNHSGDFGAPCRRETEATLDALGIAWSGPPGSIGTAEHDGIRVGLVAFHTSPSCNHVNDHDAAAKLVATAAATHDLVVVSFHGGAEGSKALHTPRGREVFHDEDRGDLRTFARAVIAAGADVVVGHGPHVLRGMELVDGHLVAYSLGNFATYGRFNLSGPLGIGAVLELELGADGTLARGRILPTRQTGLGVPVADPDARAVALIAELTAEDFGGGGLVIAQDGGFAPE